MTFLSVNPPLASIFASLSPPCITHPSIYLLGDPFSFACGANTHPLLSLVSYQMFSPCYFTHPKTPLRSSYIFTWTTSTISAVPSGTIPTTCAGILLCVHGDPSLKQWCHQTFLHCPFMHRHHGIFLQTYSSQQMLNYKAILPYHF